MSNVPGQPMPGATAVTSRDLPAPASALVVAAHPDDAEFGAGGTLAKWAASGCRVHVVVCTDGSKGTWDPAQDPAALVAARQAEQRAALRVLAGEAAAVTFLGRVDGELEADRATRAELVAVLRRVRPAVVLGHDPWRRYRLHPDHRAAGQLLCDAVVAARDPHFFPEQGLAPHRPEELLLFEADLADHAEDVGAHVEAKLAALEAHTSQHRSTMGIDAGDDGQQRTAFRAGVTDGLAALGAPLGLAAAELFKRISDL